MLHIVESTKPLARLIADLERAVARHKFGVLGVHDLKAKMAEKGVPFARECRIFEVCNPQKAKKVLETNLEVEELKHKMPTFHGGALLTKVEKPLSSSGVKPQDVVVAFDSKRVTDAAALAHDLEQAPHSGELKLTIPSGTQPERVVTVKH